jgi:prevent-host-death family protein
MKKASISDAKNGLSALIDGLKNGSPVLIVDRGRPVARLEAVSAGDDESAQLAGLIRDGVVRAARHTPPANVFTSSPPRAGKGASGVRLLIHERRDGR